MSTDKELQPVIEINIPLTEDWKEDKCTVEKIATQSTSAERFYEHTRVIEALFNRLTYETPFATNSPQRKGLLRKVYDELYPIAFFATLYYTESPDVFITWYCGSQNFDAVVKDLRVGSHRSNISHLEVTTLQGDEDANELEQLSKKGIITILGNPEQAKHLQKIEQLRSILKKKGGKNYPANTTLLVYTDEHRFHNSFEGASSPAINKKGDFEVVLNEMKDLLRGFSHVFVYSKHEIYCLLQPHPGSSNVD